MAPLQQFRRSLRPHGAEALSFRDHDHCRGHDHGHDGHDHGHGRDHDRGCAALVSMPRG